MQNHDQESPRNNEFGWVYQELTKDDGDNYNLVNCLAYILYKERKIAFITSKNGNPTEDEVKTFNGIYALPSQLDGLRSEAEAILAEVLNLSLGAKIKEVEVRLDTSLPAEMKRKFDTLQTTINSQQLEITKELSNINDRGAKYWLGEVCKGVLITTISAIIVWLLAFAFIGKTLLGEFESENIPKPPVQSSTP